MKIPNSQFPMTNQIPISKCPILKIRNWSLVGHWSLVIGHLCLLFALCSLFLVSSVSAYDPAVREELQNPLEGREVPELAGSVIKNVLSIVGSIALVIFIYGGVRWMTARGNPEQVKSAAQIMLWAALGVAMIFGSYLVLDLVFKAVTK